MNDNNITGSKHPQPPALFGSQDRLRLVDLPPPTTGIRILRCSGGIPEDELHDLLLVLPELVPLVGPQLLLLEDDLARGLVAQPVVLLLGREPKFPLFEGIDNLLNW